jgi:ubiquinone/menaquinone biosynthesis C-methylase UbiE
MAEGRRRLTYPDREFVKRQYRDASRLNARIGLHERFSTNPQGLQAWVFDHFDIPEVASILDVGCGSGLLWRKNLNRVPREWCVTLTDASPGMLDEARADLSADQRFGFWIADIQHLPSGDECFDAVIANHMLYHVPDRPRAISEISRVLRPGGTLYATTNGREMHKEMGWMQLVLDPARPSDACFSDPLGFSLENGADQLSACFTDVTMKRYSDALAVTEVDPLVDYLLSESAADAAERRTDAEEFERRVGELVELLEHELDSQGAIHITKDTGLFVARN